MEIMSSDEEEEMTPQVKKSRETLYNPYKDKVFKYFGKSKAPGTIDQYLAAFERAKKWAINVGVAFMPMDTEDLLVYLVYLSETVESYAAVKMAKYGISYVHQCARQPSPTNDPAVDLVLEATRRKWAHPVKKARPMTICIIKMLVDEILGKDVYRTPGHFKVSIVEWRTVINIVVKLFYCQEFRCHNISILLETCCMCIFFRLKMTSFLRGTLRCLRLGRERFIVQFS